MARKYNVVTNYKDDKDRMFVDCVSTWQNSAEDAKKAVRDENAECGWINIETAIFGTKQAERIMSDFHNEIHQTLRSEF
jgi:hypothetical protein